ncbi:MAG: 4Fe-4S dicluster domain-containing protein [Deltaproteobacteria bacterium]|nr:4Fe-4S dicluster domain-containing protein [Deltaproteobacteria bacterium]
MKWMPDAEAAIKNVPFFVRKKVRSRIENETAAAGKKIVSISDVKAAQARFMSKMSSDIKGYQVDTCFGSSGCPNPANNCDVLVKKIESLLENADLLTFLKERVDGDLKYHHEFRITLAECPNACSQPQIKDVGIIGAVIPEITDEACSGCEACVEACIETCITLDNEKNIPEIDQERCMKCGKCIHVCPTGTIATKRKGFRIQLGGKLGRHPKLAIELDGICSESDVLQLVKDCIDYYKKHSKHGERFAEIFDLLDFNIERKTRS